VIKPLSTIFSAPIELSLKERFGFLRYADADLVTRSGVAIKGLLSSEGPTGMTVYVAWEKGADAD
jgi:hypothetical protein